MHFEARAAAQGQKLNAEQLPLYEQSLLEDLIRIQVLLPGLRPTTRPPRKNWPSKKWRTPAPDSVPRKPSTANSKPSPSRRSEANRRPATAETVLKRELKVSVTDAEVKNCDTCVAVCLTGGEKEAEILASELRIKAEQDGRDAEIEHTAAIRQCEWEYLDMIAAKVNDADLVLSMACGIGIQSMAEKFAPKLVVPAVNTNMLGMPQEHAVWLERVAPAATA